MPREPWWATHESHADARGRRDVEDEILHELTLAQEASTWFARGEYDCV